MPKQERPVFFLDTSARLLYTPTRTKGILSLDPVGHIITNERMETDIPGVFAAGDIRHDSARQAITAAGDGATAAIYAGKFISE